MSWGKETRQRHFGDLEADGRTAYILFLLSRSETDSVSQGGVYMWPFTDMDISAKALVHFFHRPSYIYIELGVV
jgi:hypothetical protein